MMKRDIEWLKKEVWKQETAITEDYIYMRDLIYLIDNLDEPEVTLDRAFEKVSQSYPMTKEEIWRHLEQIVVHEGKVTYGEPEVLSQEWIDKHKYIGYIGMDPDNPFVYVKDLQNLVVPKQELPVIPNFVADFIEVRKGTDAYSLKYILCVAAERSEQEEYTKAYDWISANDETFARAWLDGYEVEEEPLYYALVKGHELVTNEGDLTCKYWKFDTSNGGMFLSNQVSRYGRFLNEMSKEDWNDLGINHSNADFVRVGMDK